MNLPLRVSPAAVACALALATAAHAGAPEPVRLDPHELRPSWRDAAFVAAAAGGTALAAQADLRLLHQWGGDPSGAHRDLARVARPFGSEVVLAGGAFAFAAGWLLHDDGLRASAQRADLSILAAGGCSLALKEIVGRKRPDESPGEPRAFDPFSKHNSFPSGHTTLAFAAAAALDRETRSRWVPGVVYPLAGLVGWSRIHDRKHWVSDVVMGAAIGFGVAWKAEDVQRGRGGHSSARLELDVTREAPLVAVTLRW